MLGERFGTDGHEAIGPTGQVPLVVAYLVAFVLFLVRGEGYGPPVVVAQGLLLQFVAEVEGFRQPGDEAQFSFAYQVQTVPVKSCKENKM